MRPGDSCIDHLSQSITLIKALQPPREEIFVAGQAKFRRANPDHPVREGSVCASDARASAGIRLAPRQLRRHSPTQSPQWGGQRRRFHGYNRRRNELLVSIRPSHAVGRAIVASTVGTTIEWYDFLLYSTVTGLIFGKLFFPNSDPLVGVLQAFAIYTVGFIARPIGASRFGHYGDRIGRKRALIATLLLTGLATATVGLVPTYDQIGIWGAVILTINRFIQGVGVGGEWGGSVLLSMEWARTNEHRGFITSWPQLGGPAGFLLANIAVLVFSRISGDQFLVWGWRIPFLLSLVMIAIGLYIRLGILETPAFRRIVAENRVG